MADEGPHGSHHPAPPKKASPEVRRRTTTVTILRAFGLASSRDKLGSVRAKRVAALVATAAAAQNIAVPVVISGKGRRGRPNAAAISLFGMRAMVIDKRTVDLLDDRQLGAVIEHEIGHLAKRHSLRQAPGMVAAIGLQLGKGLVGAAMTGALVLAAAGFMPWAVAVAATWAMFKASLALGAAGLVLSEGTLVASRRFEREADREAARSCKDPLALAEGLLLLQGADHGPKATAKRLELQQRELFAAQPGVMARIAHFLVSHRSSHPATHDRIRDLIEIARERGQLPAGTLADATTLAEMSRVVFDGINHVEARDLLMGEIRRSARGQHRLIPIPATALMPAGRVLSIIPPAAAKAPTIVEIALNRPLSERALRFLRTAIAEKNALSGDAAVYVVIRRQHNEAAAPTVG